MKLSILTPQSKVFEGEISAANIPTSLGQITVLPGHARLIAQVQPGYLVWRGMEGQSLRVGSGVLEVNDDHLTVLVHSAEATH